MDPTERQDPAESKAQDAEDGPAAAKGEGPRDEADQKPEGKAAEEEGGGEEKAGEEPEAEAKRERVGSWFMRSRRGSGQNGKSQREAGRRRGQGEERVDQEDKEEDDQEREDEADEARRKRRRERERRRQRQEREGGSSGGASGGLQHRVNGQVKWQAHREGGGPFAPIPTEQLKRLGPVGQALDVIQSMCCAPMSLAHLQCMEAVASLASPLPVGLHTLPLPPPVGSGSKVPGNAFNSNDVLRIQLCGIGCLAEDPAILHPMVRIHFVDAYTGQYLTKFSSEGEQGAITSREPSAQLFRAPTAPGMGRGGRDDSGGRQARNQSEVLLPVMTRPTLVKPKDLSFHPESEILIVHEPYSTGSEGVHAHWPPCWPGRDCQPER